MMVSGADIQKNLAGSFFILRFKGVTFNYKWRGISIFPYQDCIFLNSLYDNKLRTHVYIYFYQVTDLYERNVNIVVYNTDSNN